MAMRVSALAASDPSTSFPLRPKSQQSHRYNTHSVSLNSLVVAAPSCGGRRTSTLRTVAESGDIVLFKTKGWGTKVQRYFTLSEYDHVALILRDPGQSALRDIVHRTVTRVSASGVYVLEAVQGQGVLCSPWEDFYSKGWAVKYHESIVLRKLVGIRPAGFDEALWSFAEEHVGNPYYLSLAKLLYHAPGNRSTFKNSEVLKSFAYYEEHLSLERPALREDSDEPKVQQRRGSAIASSRRPSFLRGLCAEKHRQSGLHHNHRFEAKLSSSSTSMSENKSDDARRQNTLQHLQSAAGSTLLDSSFRAPSSLSQQIEHSCGETLGDSGRCSFQSTERKLLKRSSTSSLSSSISAISEMTHSGGTKSGTTTKTRQDFSPVADKMFLPEYSGPRTHSAELVLERSISGSDSQRYVRNGTGGNALGKALLCGRKQKSLTFKSRLESHLQRKNHKFGENCRKNLTSKPTSAVTVRRPSIYASQATAVRRRVPVASCTHSFTRTNLKIDELLSPRSKAVSCRSQQSKLKQSRPFFCSELVAEALIAASVFLPGTSGVYFWPVCFTVQSKSHLPFKQGYSFSDTYISAEALNLPTQNLATSSSGTSSFNQYTLLHKLKTQWLN